jgi:hypothetical protein
MFGIGNKTGDKKLSPEQDLRAKIEAMQPGQVIAYCLTDTYGGGLAIISLNPNYPEKGKKYTMSTESLKDGKPSGNRRQIWDSDKSKDLSSWVFDRSGATPFQC